MVPGTKVAPFPQLKWGVIFFACVVFFSFFFMVPVSESRLFLDECGEWIDCLSDFMVSLILWEGPTGYLPACWTQLVRAACPRRRTSP